MKNAPIAGFHNWFLLILLITIYNDLISLSVVFVMQNFPEHNTPLFCLKRLWLFMLIVGSIETAMTIRAI